MAHSVFLQPESEAQIAFLRDLERVAHSDVTVLVEGENGSGKTTAARRLHAESPRSGEPMVEVPLAALSPTLIEAELFGHVAGAFTGASHARQGRFRAAEGGTLVLDGVDCLPLELQVKLLRALQERQIEPLGSEQVIGIDVRVIATSSVDLMGEVAAGRFREDLYYRLAVVVLHVPPLRSRAADLPKLCRALLRRVADRSRLPTLELAPKSLDRLAAHPWPGNVRELENALERVLALRGPAGNGSVATAIEPEELLFLEEAVQGEESRLARMALAAGLNLDTLANAMMNEALAEQRGNVTAAARQLGLSRRAFEYRMRKSDAPKPTSEDASGDDTQN
ncbi:MAG: DNA-binding NtrC family response regulator [Planctomycetota bacterium]|jgi:DNA-binding NtrC family response regulator